MDHPKKPRGRPRKHATSDAATQARKASDRRRYERSRQPHAPSDFIMYEPPLPCNIPVDTPPQTGLRISLNIQVPPEHDIQSYDTYEDNHPLSALVQRACPLTLQDDANNAETTQRIQQIQKYEQENSAEQEEYKARVTAQMTAADYEAAETLKALQGKSEERQRSVGVSSQHSDYIQRFDDSDLSAQRNSSPALRTNNNLSNIQRSSQPLTLRNKNSPGSQPQSSGSKGKRSVPFPAQKNNLLGWMNPGVHEQQQECLPVEIENRATPITPTASPRPPINDLTARAPQPSGHTPSPSTNNPQEERTAFKLAKQLRRFQGCTHEQHQQADRNHQEHHQRPDVHPKCSSMADITPLVRGSYNGGTPLPDVLSSPKLMKATDLRGTLILETIEDNPGLHRFRGATLFSNAKNTKVEFNRKSLTQAYEVWEQRWSDATNPEFYNKDRTYVDLAKQVTSKDSAVPYDEIPEDHEAETPFDSAKVYVFDNDSVENLALDPGYVRSLQQEGGVTTFSKGVCEFAYLSSKKRAHANLLDNRWRLYGIREEHRISLSMMEEIYQQWVQWDLYDADDVGGGSSPLPYYVVPTDELLSFLYAQINKYCFLFEHILAHTAKTYSLPETMVMVVAL
ncbi:hypothetical protein V502_02555 [Pseudogymnoascus sp. VKM F-4520 (FW-2644)]|nr:hypothetical protein V502_02555 [Pseudogymnoascus sp. VKM F-4520 (FW-2644)]